jgi:hypothetical protein
MKRALIVDDSRLARTVLSRLLRQNGVASDALERAPPNQPAASCERIGSPDDEAVSVGKRQAFANAVATAAARYPLLKIERAWRGSAEPAVDYPASSSDFTARTWNAIAAANQRVAVKILPDRAAPVAGARR